MSETKLDGSLKFTGNDIVLWIYREWYCAFIFRMSEAKLNGSLEFTGNDIVLLIFAYKLTCSSFE